MVERTNVVLHVIRTEHVLRAKFFVGVDARGSDRGENTSQTGETALLGAAGDGFHFLDHGAIVVLLVASE
jgi:hypothetical protein